MNINTQDRFKDNLTDQEVFNLGAYHLGTMTERCYSWYGCVYKRSDGNSCALGYFFSKEEYTSSMENNAASNLKAKGLFPERLLSHFNILNNLQMIHDSKDNWTIMGKLNHNREFIRDKLRSLAILKNLNKDILDHPDMVWNKKEG